MILAPRTMYFAPRTFKPMRILITGASGLLGLNTALETADQHTVLGQVNRNLIHTEAFHVLPIDLLEPGAVERLLDQTQPDWVIHCAALANLEACENDPELAREFGTALVPFLLNSVGGQAELNQADGIHPTAGGHEIIAEKVFPFIKELL